MTCIIGLKHGNDVYIGGDSKLTGSISGTIQTVSQPKVFRLGYEFIVGCSGSCRVQQIIEHVFHPPCREYNETSDISYLVKSFIPALRNILKDNWKEDLKTEEWGGPSLLLGYKGNIYEICADFQITSFLDDMATIGSGYQVALGAMEVARKFLGPSESILAALEATATYINSVGPPFTIIKSNFLVELDKNKITET